MARPIAWTEWVSVDAPESACYDMPIYEGTVAAAHHHIVPGEYRAYDSDGNAVVLHVYNDETTGHYVS